MYHVVWDEKHLKALLRLPRYPLRLVQEEPWCDWIEAQGGMRAVLDYLRTCTLSRNQRRLLEVILAHPEASVQSYSDKLCVSPRTYDNYLRGLTASLLPHLNTWRTHPMSMLAPQRVNLPAPLTSLIGVDQTVTEVVALLRHHDVRLLTLIGPGGVGKTRVAIQAARALIADFPAGVGFVPLAPVRDPELVMTTIVQALCIEKDSAQSAQSALRSYLCGRQFLLVLDNFEHLISAAPIVFDLLCTIPKLKILVTSREVLHLYGEHCFTVSPLVVPDKTPPDTFDKWKQCASIRLFVERARAVQAEFTLTPQNGVVIADICRAIDGLPLAIELAAACIKWSSPNQICDKLNHALELLNQGFQGLPLRHQALRSTIAWSYELLDAEEQAFFRQMSVFEADWSTEAARAVYGLPNTDVFLRALANKSLVQVVAREGEEVRFKMLQTIRDYAREQLDAQGETEDARRRCMTYYIELIETAEHEYNTPRQLYWFSRLEREHSNLRAVLQWLIEADAFDAIFRLLGAFWQFGRQYALSETMSWVELALARGKHITSASHAKTLWGGGWLLVHQGKTTLAQRYFEESYRLAEALGEQHLMGLARQGIGNILLREGHNEAARQIFEANVDIFRRLHDNTEVAWAFDQLGRVALAQRDYDQALQIFDKSLAIFRTMGNAWGMSITLEHLGRIAVAWGDYKKAQEFFEESLSIVQWQQHHWCCAWILEGLSNALIAQKKFDQAEATLKQALCYYIDIQNTQGHFILLECFANLWSRCADYLRAVQMGAALQAQIDAGLVSLPRLNQVRLQSTLATARCHLDPASFVAAWQAGIVMDLEASTAFALDSDDDVRRKS